MDREYGIAPPGYRLPDATRLGRVRLLVAELERALAYYERVLGLRVVSRDGARASLGTPDGTVPGPFGDPIPVPPDPQQLRRIAKFSGGRFFAVDDAPAFHFGLAYDHFVAGGDSIARLLRRLVEDYYRIAAAGAPPPHIDLYPPGYRRLFARQVIPLARGLSSWRQLIASCRRSARPPYPKDGDGYNGVVFARLAPAEPATLAATARAWGTTQNDIFLAIMLKALSPQVAERRQARRRRDLAVGSIVNVRRDFGARGAEGFAPLLGSFRVAHPVPDDMPLSDLARFVCGETSGVKRRKLYLQTLLAIAVSGLQWRFLSSEERQRFHAKNYAVWAGVTPLQLNALWPEAKSYPFRVGYVRAVSTGPLSPLVLALTTLGDVVEVALSFRRSAIDRRRAESLLTDIVHSIRSIAP